MKNEVRGDISIVLAGEAGQGIQSIESILAKALKKGGYHLFATKEYMSRIRGGVNSTEIRASSKRVSAFVDKINVLITLTGEGAEHLKKRIDRDTLIVDGAPFEKIAVEAGNPIYSSSAAAGFVCGLLGIDRNIMTDIIAGQFSKKSADIQIQNKESSLKGYDLGLEYVSDRISIKIDKDDNVSSEMVLSGAEAIALGALAGGCNYACAYPMSPSTGVLTALADYSKNVDIIVEQVEDEVGALNMALGAWYAGAKAIVTTSGGGFALMTEALSLAGMIESPAVILLAQRPGPATGLPTRTEQGDLNLVLYAGHGVFPRVILAPGSLEEAFNLSQKAFYIADRYQVPAVILADQYLADSYYNIPVLKLPGTLPENHFVKTAREYKRYQITQDGLSPRGIPGFGEGLVKLDSDEHDENGFITEDPEMRVRMVDKRLAKGKLLEKEIIPPDLIGDINYKTLIIGWGSTKSMILEALEKLVLKKTAYLHFSQVYPLYKGIESYLKKARDIIIIENNETGQFADLIKLETGFDIKNRILKYDGLPFSVEEICEQVNKFIK